MKQFVLIIAVTIISSEIIFGQHSELNGAWVSLDGNSSLVFKSENLLRFDGVDYQFYTQQNFLIVNVDNQLVYYPFQLSNGTLQITFPEGYSISFKKSNKTSSQNQPNAGTANTDANHSGMYLSGTLCEYGSSSSYSSYSSYSHTNRIYCDGRGNFTFSSEQSYSGAAGQSYGQSNDPSQRGTYKILQNQVLFTFANGESYYLQIHMYQNDGRITELKYGEKLYAAGLCD